MAYWSSVPLGVRQVGSALTLGPSRPALRFTAQDSPSDTASKEPNNDNKQGPGDGQQGQSQS